MRRWITLPLLVLGALALAATTLADPGNGGKSKQKKHSKMTFAFVTPDNGSCSTPWATDTLTRTFQLQARGDGSFTLTRRDRGRFVTLGGASPGSCQTKGKHGHTVLPGVRGKIVGYLRGTVTGGTFNPNATCTGPTCGDTQVFVATFFGAGAKFSCLENSADCRFNFNYTAPAKQPNQKTLKFRHWQDKGKGAGTFLKEVFIGDIANA